MTTQIAVKLPDATVDEVDRLVSGGAFTSRSEAVRAGLALVLAQSRAEEIDRAFAAGFARVPDSEADLAVAGRLAEEAINDEIWEPWW